MPPALFPAAHSSMLSRSWALRILCYTDKTIFEISQACHVRVPSSISSDLTWPKRELYYLIKMGETGTCGQIVQCLPDCWQLELAAGLTVPLQWIWGKWTKKLQEWSKNMEQLPHNKLLQRLQLLKSSGWKTCKWHKFMKSLMVWRLDRQQKIAPANEEKKASRERGKKNYETSPLRPPTPERFTSYCCFCNCD